MSQLLVFTVCSTSQFVFANQLKRSLPVGVRFVVGLTDGEHDEAVSVQTIGIPALDAMRQRYDEAAFIAACKPFFAAYFLQDPTLMAVVYADPTVLFFGDLGYIEAELTKADVLLTPRLTRPFSSTDYSDEKHFLNTGMYDAGFWTMRNSSNVHALLRWWQARLTDRAHLDWCHGMNHDQLWYNYFPIYFERVRVVKHRNWNVGLHNLHERTLTRRGGRWVVNASDALLFFNFRECLQGDSVMERILKQQGATELVKSYRKTLGMIPAIYSVRQMLHPSQPRWRRRLRQWIQGLIHDIDTYPLYHE